MFPHQINSSTKIEKKTFLCNIKFTLMQTAGVFSLVNSFAINIEYNKSLFVYLLSVQTVSF